MVFEEKDEAVVPYEVTAEKRGQPVWKGVGRGSVKVRIRVPLDMPASKTITGVVLTPEITRSEREGNVLGVYGSLESLIYYEPAEDGSAGGKGFTGSMHTIDGQKTVLDSEGLNLERDNYFLDLADLAAQEMSLEWAGEKGNTDLVDLEILGEGLEASAGIQCLRHQIPFYLTIRNIYYGEDHVLQLIPRVEEVDCQIRDPRLLDLQVEMTITATTQQRVDNLMDNLPLEKNIDSLVTENNIGRDNPEEDKVEVKNLAFEENITGKNITVEEVPMIAVEMDLVQEGIVLPVETAVSIYSEANLETAEREPLALEASSEKEAAFWKDVEKILEDETEEVWPRSEEINGFEEEAMGFPDALGELPSSEIMAEAEPFKTETFKEVEEIEKVERVDAAEAVEKAETIEAVERVDAEPIVPVGIGYQSLHRRRPGWLEREARLVQKKQAENEKPEEPWEPAVRRPRALARPTTRENEKTRLPDAPISEVPSSRFDLGSVDKERLVPTRSRSRSRQTNPFRYYLIQPGDSWQQIAAHYHLTVEEIQAVNPDWTEDPYPGKRLKIPSGNHG